MVVFEKIKNKQLCFQSFQSIFTLLARANRAHSTPQQPHRRNPISVQRHPNQLSQQESSLFPTSSSFEISSGAGGTEHTQKKIHRLCASRAVAVQVFLEQQ